MIKIHLSRIFGEKRWTQAQLARKTGIRPNTISELYNELNDRINIEHLDILCNVLECQVSDLLEYEPTNNREFINK